MTSAMTPATDAVGTAPTPTAIVDAYEAAERRRKIYGFILFTIVAAALIGGLRVTEDANAGGFFEGIVKLFDYPIDIISAAIGEGWAWFAIPFQMRPQANETYFSLLIETLNMAVAATLIGATLAFCMSFIASANLVKNKTLVWSARRFMDFARAFPEIVLALFLIYVISKSPIAAVAAIAFHTIGALGKLFSEVIENADMRPVEGLASSGASWLQRIWFGVVPQVLPNFLSYTLLRLEINVRASAIMGFVGAGGLGQQFKAVVDWKYGADITAILALLIGAIFFIDWISARARRRLIGPGGH